MAVSDVAARLTAVKTSVLTAAEAAAAKTMLQDDAAAGVRAAGERESSAWEKVKTIADWEQFRDRRMDALRASFSPVFSAGAAFASDAGYQVTGRRDGDGFRVENLAIAGRPGQPIAANLYVPSASAAGMPGILLVPSHDQPKWEGELQDMGMTWARSGCAVLVMDAIGQGERRQQVFGGEEDYRWRYYLGMQLHTVGESLMAWMVADLRRGLDVLTALPAVDKKRIIVIGAVGGGGDQAAVLAATDSRVTCVIPFNDCSVSQVAGKSTGDVAWVRSVSGGNFDATRCLRHSGRDGFNPWLMVAASAPRHTVFAREFDWTPDGDEGFARLARIFELYGARDHLDAIHGAGDGAQPATAAWRCSNVGPRHRKELYPILERWMGMTVPKEFQGRLAPEALKCLTPPALERRPMRPVHDMLIGLAKAQVDSARKRLALLPPERQAAQLREDWSALLGDVAVTGSPEVKRSEPFQGEGFSGERVLLSAGQTIQIPVLLLKPAPDGKRAPVVIGVAQGGKDMFLAKRATEVAELLSQGIAIALVDVRGTGETRPAGDRYWHSAAIELAALDLALGRTALGGCVRDLRGVLRYLQSRGDLDGRRVAVWGESFAAVNPPKFVDPPMKTDVSAAQAEPMGAMVALLAGLMENDVRAVVARGGLAGYAALMDGPACHVALDVIVPGVLEHGDVADVVAALVPRAVRVEGAVDGRNRLAGPVRLAREFAPVQAAYRETPDRLVVSDDIKDDVADWIGRALKGQGD